MRVAPGICFRVFPTFLTLLALTAVSGVHAHADTVSEPGFRDTEIEYQGTHYRILKVDLTKVKVEMFWNDRKGIPYSSLPRLKDAIVAHGHHFLAATNAGIFAKSLDPLGLFVERGKQKVPLNLHPGGRGNFFMKPNGVFLITKDGAEVVESHQYRGVHKKVLEATQSGPLLLEDGKIHPRFKKGSLNRKIRSAVGVQDPHHVIVALAEDPVNFYDFALLFKDKLHCPDALYLDGTISTIQGEKDPPQESISSFVGMIGFFKD